MTRAPPPAGEWPGDPLRALLGFHKRIRVALDTLEELAEEAGKGRADPMVAQALWDFITGPLAWHDQDEEASLLPRLRRVQHPPRLERLLDAVSVAHGQIGESLAGLSPHLREVASGAAVADPERIAALARDLRGMFEPHLSMEEQEILPLARLLLTEEDLEEIRDEMAGRLARRREGTPRLQAPQG